MQLLKKKKSRKQLVLKRKLSKSMEKIQQKRLLELLIRMIETKTSTWSE